MSRIRPCFRGSRLLFIAATVAMGVSGARALPAQTFEDVVLLPFGSSPLGIASGPDGAVWFVESAHATIGRVAITGEYTTYIVNLNPDFAFQQIIAGPDGALWFNEDNRIGRIAPDGQIQHRSFGRQAYASHLVLGPDGAIWFTDPTNGVGRIRPGEDATFYPWPTLPGSTPNGIAVGPDGRIWVTRGGSASQILGVSLTGAMTSFPMPEPAIIPREIVAGSDGNLWFAEEGRARIGKITTDGVVTESKTAGRLLGAVARASAGNVWFAEEDGILGRVDPSGTVVEYGTYLRGADYQELVSGPDGKIWYTYTNFGSVSGVGRFTLPETAAPAVFLSGGRFEATVSWTTATGSGVGRSRLLTGDSTAFWFFTDNNLELIIKVVDGRAFNGKFWVLGGELTDVAFTLTIRDTLKNVTKTYVHAAGKTESFADTAAFDP